MDEGYVLTNKKVFWRVFYKIVDKLLPRSGICRFAAFLRNRLARRISLGISKKAFIEKGATIMPEIFVDDFGCIGINCVTACGLHVGSHTMMGPNVHFYTNSHRRSDDCKKFIPGFTIPKPIIIGSDCWIGYNSIILGGVTIGNGTTIGAGSVVTKSAPNYSLVAGNPAKVVKKYVVEVEE